MNAHDRLRVLVLGASGMLGNAVLRVFANHPDFSVYGTARSQAAWNALPPQLRERVECGVDVLETDSLVRLFARTRPALVINCVGVVKQLAEADDPLVAIPVNALLPHRLARLCGDTGARLVHVSTDCVFAGTRSMYREQDVADAQDLYGRSKLLGEVDYPHAITLRTSIIGHAVGRQHGLVDWFLAQAGPVKGFRRAFFSGLPTVELARVIQEFVVPHAGLHGLYHVSAAPLSKLDLLQLVARVYGKSIAIEPDDALVMDRSLDSTRFREATGYRPPDWPDLVRRMHEFA